MPQLAVAVGGGRVGDKTKMSDDPPQPGRVQPTGRLHQHRLRRHSHIVGEVLGAMSQHPSMGHSELPSDQGLSGGGQRTTEQGPGGPDEAGRGPGAQLQPGPQPTSRRANLLALVSPGSPPAVDSCKLLEPVTLQPVNQPPQGQDLLGQGGIGQAVQILSGQPIHSRRQYRQPVRPPARILSRMCVRVQGGNLSSSRPKATTNAQSGDNFCTHPTRPTIKEKDTDPHGDGHG